MRNVSQILAELDTESPIHLKGCPAESKGMVRDLKDDELCECNAGVLNRLIHLMKDLAVHVKDHENKLKGFSK